MTPEYLNENWTEELLLLMFEARAERRQPSDEDAPQRPPKVPKVDNSSFLENVNGFGGGGIGYERK